LNTGHGTNVAQIDFSDDSTLLLSCGNDGKFNTYTVGTWTPTTSSTTIAGGQSTACDFASNGNIGYSNSANLAVYSGLLGSLMTDNSKNYLKLKFVPGGTSLIMTNPNDKKGYYYTVSPKTLTSIVTDSAIIGSVAYAKTSNYFGMGSQSNQVYIFNGTSNDNSLLFQWGMSNQVNAIDFSDDGLKLVAGDKSGVVNIFK
jgi:WD40 repeat protein